MSKTTVLVNDHHGTEYRTRRTLDEVRDMANSVHVGVATNADKAFYRRLWKALCGTNGCDCGTITRARPA